jgi:outer membrane immunogenic protein
MQKAVGITVAALTLAATQAAMAADIGARPYGAPAPAYRTAPAMMAIYNWSGFYAGGNIGYSWGKAKTDVTTPGFTVDAATAGASVPVVIPGSAFSESLKPNGVIGGGQIGWNSQVSNWVLGLEADWQASGQKDNRGRSDAFAFTVTSTTPDFAVAGTSDTSLEARLKWFGTVRGRLGYAWDSVLVYGTGGLAYGKFNVSGVNTVAGTATCVVTAVVCTAPVVTPFSQTTSLNSSKSKAGWTLGAGIEGAAFLPNWTWKAEYLYLDFGKLDHSFATAAVAPITTSGLITTSTRATDHILRFGVNYRFAGGNIPVARW